jgi:hypothetical protein
MVTQCNHLISLPRMKIINTKLHGILDYLLMFALLLPWIVNYYTHSEDTWIFAAFGAVIGLYSLITNYEFGMIKFLPMKIHLLFDAVTAVFLVVSPWLFHLRHYYYYWPFAIGISLLLTVIFSSTAPYRITKRDLDITKP